MIVLRWIVGFFWHVQVQAVQQLRLRSTGRVRQNNYPTGGTTTRSMVQQQTVETFYFGRENWLADGNN